MFSSTIASQIIAFIAFAASASAAPLVATPNAAVTDYKVWAAQNTNIVARDDVLNKRSGALFACNSRDFLTNEGCIRLVVSIGVCANFPSGFVDSVSSIGPDSDLVCSLFDNTGCNRNQGVIDNVVSPGFHDLSQVRHPDGGNWNDKMASYQCFRS